MAKRKIFDASTKLVMKDVYESGVPLRSLAAQFGVSIPTVAKYIREVGGNVRRPGYVAGSSKVRELDKVNEILEQAKQEVGNPCAEIEVGTMVAPRRTILSLE